MAFFNKTDVERWITRLKDNLTLYHPDGLITEAGKLNNIHAYDSGEEQYLRQFAGITAKSDCSRRQVGF